MNKFGKYILYALGEILLITIGVLIAVNINKKESIKKDNIIRCQYLDELNFVFDYDIEDVEGNIQAFKRWNPAIKEILDATKAGSFSGVDSLDEKMNAIHRYIFFGQRSKGKIEELKYSNINLIENRKLKNKILLYADSEIEFLRDQERRYNLADEDRRQYYNEQFGIFELDKIIKDKSFYFTTALKYQANKGMQSHYEELLQKQYEIKEMIESELQEKCPSN